MKDFVTIVKSTDGVLDKYQDFDLERDATEHAVSYGGFVVQNPGDNTRYWVVDEARRTVTYDQAAADADTTEIVDTQYQRDRRKAYGGIGDQLDMVYWDQVNGTATFKNHIAAVKAAHPKP